jgi:hypothetical protein
MPKLHQNHTTPIQNKHYLLNNLWGADTGSGAQCIWPVQLASLKSLYSTWEFELTHTIPGGTNVTYDIWLSSNEHADNENPTGEVMVWLHKTGEITPIGSEVDRVMIEGMQWRLWQGAHPVSGWTVYSFVREENTNCQTLDLVHFFRHLAVFGLNQTDYLLGVQTGPEIFTGEGTLETIYYDIVIDSD